MLSHAGALANRIGCGTNPLWPRTLPIMSLDVANLAIVKYPNEVLVARRLAQIRVRWIRV